MGQLKKDGIYLMYLRKSRADNQDETVEEVLSKHEKLLQDYFMRELGHKIPEDCIYREVVSGGESIADREEMCKVLARIEDPNVLGCACADPQRLSRGSLTDCDLLIDKLRFTKTLVITPVMVYDLENKMERRFFQDELMRGRDYLEYVKEVLYRGRYQSAARGCFVMSQPPYGYDKVKIGKDWTLEPNDKADIVRMIFSWYVKEYKTPGRIVQDLNKMLIPPSTGREWGRESVLLILKNVHYDGKVVFGRKKQTVVFENGNKVTKRIKQKTADMLIVEGKHPAIVDHEMFELAQERIAGRAYIAPRTRKALTNPFAGLLFCPVCGYAMTLHFASNCDSKRLNCKHYCSKTLRYNDLVSAVKTALLTEHLPELEAKRRNGEGESAAIQQQLIDKLEKQMADFKTQETKQYDLLETGIYSNEVFLERNTALRAKMTQCAEQLAEAKKNLPQSINYEEKIISLKEAVDALDDDTVPVERKNRLLKAIIKRMEYSGEKNQPFGTNEFTLSITLNI